MLLDNPELRRQLRDPIKFGKAFWPGVHFFPKQRDMIMAVRESKATYVVAGNELGKDFTAGFICATFFIAPWLYYPAEYVAEVEARKLPNWNPHDRRIVCTSAAEKHLNVLFAEICRFLYRSKYPLIGTEVSLLSLEIRLKNEEALAGKNIGSYLRGLVWDGSGEGESLSGHHAAYTLAVGDESSALSWKVFNQFRRWADRELFFGNPNPTENPFRKEYEKGDLLAPAGSDPPWHRRTMKIMATDCPNVQRGLLMKARGLVPDGKEEVPGALSWANYQFNLATYNKQQVTEGLLAEWYTGAELMLFPPEVRAFAVERHRNLGNRLRRALAIGVDPAEGGDRTAWCAVDEFGIIEIISKQTPNTAVIPGETIAFMRKHGMMNRAEYVCFDRACGKAHADIMRGMGHRVRTIHFGAGISMEPKRAKRFFPEKLEQKEDRDVYKNRRAEMYIELSQMFAPKRDPDGKIIAGSSSGFAMPPASMGDAYERLNHQLSKMPRLTDEEGKFWMLPKNAPPKSANPEDVDTLVKRIGHSPDEADALALAVWSMNHRPLIATAGVA